MSHYSRHTIAAGPLVWLAILATTSLLLVVFQQVLWLVVPFLLALVIYYTLLPWQGRLVLAGVSVERAAAIVAGVAFSAMGGALALAAPWIANHAVSWQDWVAHYLEGGIRFIVHALGRLERSTDLLAHAHWSEEVRKGIRNFSSTFVNRYLATALVNLAAWLPSLLLAPFMAFFFLRDGRRLKKFIVKSVPNAFFERTLSLLDELDRTARLYFQGLLKLTALDASALGIGLWLLGMSTPLLLGVVTAVLAWVPYVGSIIGCALVVLVAATDFPGNPGMAYGTIALFLFVRMLDDFFFMPLTIGRSLHLHPLLTVLMIFVGGAVAGVAGLMLVLPLLGVVMVLGETLGQILNDPRLRARHAYARKLRHAAVTADLK
ncbi:AI-2E family transporter [Azospira inquinata]|uniref:AI-2E family transporter n=1 Tax=Azospira inquinata TaxID=2785627 RepID=UPI001C0DA50F|nr:AI-2E family transporter [Azospira inquinata]QWT45669.1 AI-2E family transporter [Azospira inquinata]